MKECKDCEYFDGYDYSDGTPCCEYDGGYEKCPYNYEPNKKEYGSFCQIDMSGIDDFIKESIMNCVEGRIIVSVDNIVKSEIEKTYKEVIQTKTKEAVDKMIDTQIEEYMAGDITIGGGWYEPERKIPRNKYLGEIVEKALDEKIKNGEAIKSEVKNAIRIHVDKFSNDLKRDINNGLKDTFDNATRQILTDNVVSMLMCNDTYRKLSDSMKSLLPEK